MRIALVALFLIMATARIDFSTEVNRHFQPLFWDRHEYLILWGGSSSGKSHFACQKLIWRAMVESEQGRHNFLILRKYRKWTKDTCYKLFKFQLDAWGLPYNENKTDLVIEFNGTHFYFMGLDDPTGLKSLPKISGAWFEEPTELTPDERRMAMNYIRGNVINYVQIIFTFNPVSKFNSIYDELFKSPLSGDLARYDHSTYHDNDWMLVNDPRWIRWIEAQKEADSNFYSVYGLGEWGELKGLIFPDVKVQEFDNKLSYYDAIIGGQDWGYNDPAALILTGIKDWRIYVFDEVYESNRTNPDLIKLNADVFTRNKLDRGAVTVFADHEPSDIDEFNDAGFNYTPAEKDIELVTQIKHLKRYQIIVHPRCTNMITEDRTYKWKEKDGQLTDIPLDFKNHAQDARRYAVFSHYIETLGGADFFVV